MGRGHVIEEPITRAVVGHPLGAGLADTLERRFREGPGALAEQSPAAFGLASPG
jgi:hypothetical protein